MNLTPHHLPRHPKNRPDPAPPEYMEPTADSCRDLWASVLLRAIADAYTRPHLPTIRDGMTDSARANAISAAQQAKNLHARAKGYIGSSDFRLVCWLAGHDPEFVMEALRDRPDVAGRTKSGGWPG